MRTSPAGNNDGFALEKRSAEHGFTPMWRSAEQGFTLIELMIVIAILAVASAAVVMVMPDPRGRLRDEATRFAARARAARDAAVTGARPVEIWVTGAGYGFAERIDGQWRPMSARPFRVVRWPEGIHATNAAREQLVFDSIGMADRALDVTIARDGNVARVSLGGDGSVRVSG